MKRLSYASKPRTTPYVYSTICDIVRQHSETDPDKEILVHRSSDGARHAITYKQLEERSTGLARYLLHCGARRGSNIAIYGSNTLEWVVGELAILKAGAISVHLSYSTSDAEDAMGILKETNSHMLVLDPGLNMELLKPIEVLIQKVTKHNENNPIDQLKVVLLRNITSFEHLVYNANSDEANMKSEFCSVYPEDTAIVYTTSGSTGRSKLIQHSHFGIVNGSEIFDESFGTSKGVVFNDRPFAWKVGSPIFNLISKSTRMFTDTIESAEGMKARYIWKMIKEENCSKGFMMPYLLFDICDWKENSMEEKDDFLLQSIAFGGQRIDATYERAFGIVCSGTIYSIYGCTESWLIGLDETRFGEKITAGSAGTVYPGVEVKIVDTLGNPIHIGQAGDVYIRSGYISQGHYQSPQQNEELFASGGWVRTGDIGSMDENFMLTISGRSKDVISRGGRKILPGIIEDTVVKMEELERVSVLAVPDARLYEEVCVCYVAKSDRNDIGNKDIEAFCRQKFLKTQTLDSLTDVPKHFIQLDDLPKLANGKVDKIRLKEHAMKTLNLKY